MISLHVCSICLAKTAKTSQRCNLCFLQLYKLTSVCTTGLCNGKAADARLTRIAVDGELAIHKRADLADGVGHDGQFEEDLITSLKITERRKRRRKGKAGRGKRELGPGGRFSFSGDSSGSLIA